MHLKIHTTSGQGIATDDISPAELAAAIEDQLKGRWLHVTTIGRGVHINPAHIVSIEVMEDDQ